MITDHSSLTPFMQRVRKVHFIGIGGVGMSGIAEVMNTIGYEVSGSDLTEGPVTEKLKAAGIKVFKGHTTGNVSDVDVVVTSSAIPDDACSAARRNAGRTDALQQRNCCCRNTWQNHNNIFNCKCTGGR